MCHLDMQTFQMLPESNRTATFAHHLQVMRIEEFFIDNVW